MFVTVLHIVCGFMLGLVLVRSVILPQLNKCGVISELECAVSLEYLKRILFRLDKVHFPVC